MLAFILKSEHDQNKLACPTCFYTTPLKRTVRVAPRRAAPRRQSLGALQIVVTEKIAQKKLDDVMGGEKVWDNVQQQSGDARRVVVALLRCCVWRALCPTALRCKQSTARSATTSTPTFSRCRRARPTSR